MSKSFNFDNWFYKDGRKTSLPADWLYTDLISVITRNKRAREELEQENIENNKYVKIINDLRNILYISLRINIPPFIKEKANQQLDQVALAIISISPNYCCQYANDILKGRFELGEPTIKKSVEYTDKYLSCMKEHLSEDEFIKLKLEF